MNHNVKTLYLEKIHGVLDIKNKSKNTGILSGVDTEGMTKQQKKKLKKKLKKQMAPSTEIPAESNYINQQNLKSNPIENKNKQITKPEIQNQNDEHVEEPELPRPQSLPNKSSSAALQNDEELR